MTQLSFEPALDPYHTIFRLLRLFPIIKLSQPVPKDQVRILDYFLAFPHRLRVMRFKNQHRNFRKIANRLDSNRFYAAQPDDNVIFVRMEPIQEAAFQNLAYQNFIDKNKLSDGWIFATSKSLDYELAERIAYNNENDAELISVLKSLLLDYSLLGAGGLKDRSGLLEHRYDNV